MNRRSLILASLAAAALGALPAAALDYPKKPIRIVVPYAPGGSTDIAARTIGERLGARLGVQVIIDNRAGAGGNVGAGVVSRAEPDGYTILFTGSAIASSPSMKDIPFKFPEDFAPISMGVYGQFSLLVNPSMPIRNTAELLAYARANPGKLNVACSGALTSAHFALEMFKEKAGLDFVVVQYNGNAPAATAMMSGETPVGIDAAFTAKGAVAGGRLRAIAVMGAQRSPVMPDLPTLAESGLPGFDAGFWLGLFAPAGTPKEVVALLSREIAAVSHDQALREKLAGQGMEPVASTPEEFTAYVTREVAQNARIIAALRAAGQVQ